MFCGEQTLVGEAGGHGIVASAKCRRWSCPQCAIDNQRKLRGLIVELDPTIFITITSSPHCFADQADRARHQRKAWTACRRRLRRLTGERLDCVSVFAATKRGEPHIHAVVKCSLLSALAMQRLLSRWMSADIGECNIDARPVTDVYGLSAYISAQAHLFAGCQRYWTSRGWRVRKWIADTGFMFLALLRATLPMVEQMIVARGHIIVERSTRRLRTLVPFNPP